MILHRKDCNWLRGIFRTQEKNPRRKDRNILMYLLEDVYDILHIVGYYRELRSKKAIDGRFEKVEK